MLALLSLILFAITSEREKHLQRAVLGLILSNNLCCENSLTAALKNAPASDNVLAEVHLKMVKNTSPLWQVARKARKIQAILWQLSL